MIDICKWALYLEVTEKLQKRSFQMTIVKRSTRRTVIHQVAEALPKFAIYTLLAISGDDGNIFFWTPQIGSLTGSGSLMEDGMC